MSYKKPYQFEDTDNANVLRRAEVISRLHGHRRANWWLPTPRRLPKR
jgi:hypothetical protein